MAAIAQQAVSVPVGLVKTFGSAGPQYEILGYVGRSSTGVDLVRIQVVRSGEELDYSYSEMMTDPEAL